MKLIGWLYWQYIKHLRKRYRMRMMQQAAARGKGWYVAQLSNTR